MKGHKFGKPFYQATVWKVNDVNGLLLLEDFTTKKEAVNCVIDFLCQYSGNDEELDCYVRHFDVNECCDYTFDLNWI